MKKGFTLAETLITLGIIGIVAALTMPSLVSNYQDKVFQSSFKDVINRLSNAAEMLKVDENTSDISDSSLGVSSSTTNFSASSGNFLKKYLSVTKDCGQNTNSGCISESIFYEDGSEHSITTMNPGYCVSTINGHSVCMKPFKTGYPAEFYIDVNGIKGPNAIGKDIACYNMDLFGTMTISNACGGFSAVYLVSYGSNKVQVIKTVREATGLGLGEAKTLVESAPCIIKENLSTAQAKNLKSTLEAVGAVVELR